MNRIKEVLTSKGVSSGYKFWKQSGLSQTTAYRIWREPAVYPDKETTETICKVFGLQPGDFLYYQQEGDRHD